MIDRIMRMVSVEVKSVVSVVAILIVGMVLYALARRGLKILARRGRLPDPLIRFLRILLRWTAVTILLLLVLQELGILQNAWAAVLAAAAMVAVGFIAVWSILSNALCTLLILIYKPFWIGDAIEIPSESIAGRVTDLNLMFTTLEAESGRLVQIPNNLFFQKVIVRERGKDEVSLFDQFLKH